MRGSSPWTPAPRSPSPGWCGSSRVRRWRACARAGCGTLAHFQGMKSAPQHPLARGRATWQGEPVAAVVAESRAIAEDGVARLAVEWEPLPVVTDPETALDPTTPVIHPELGDNLAFTLELRSGDPDAAFRGADHVYRDTFWMGRHTGVTLEPRVILADFEPSERRLTVYHSFQAPNMMQDILARHLGLPEHHVRVICKDVGGSFGIKVHIYPDEMATCALAVLLGRPVKFVADRLESFQSDIHARDHRVTAEVAVRRDGTICWHAGGRPHRDRSLLRVSAHERGGGQPDRSSHPRRISLPRLRRPPARRVPEQDADVPVPRGGASDSLRGDGGHGGPGGARAAPGSGRGAPEELRHRRHVPAHLPDRLLLRAPFARGVPGSAAGNLRLPRALCRARRPARERGLPRAGPLRLHRADDARRPPSTAWAARASRRKMAARSSSSRGAG